MSAGVEPGGGGGLRQKSEMSSPKLSQFSSDGLEPRGDGDGGEDPSLRPLSVSRVFSPCIVTY